MAGSTSSEKGASALDSVKSSQDKQKMLLSADAGHFSMIRAFHLADLITVCNGLCGFLSILHSLKYCLSQSPSAHQFPHPTRSTPPDPRQIYTALALIPLGLFFDFMDGKVARWRHKSSLMGQELDSLADLVSFGVAPATAAFALGLRTPLDMLLLSFFVLCGLTRLARFNVTVQSLPKDGTGKSRYFEGFPIPTSLGLVTGMALCVGTGRIHDGVVGGLVGAGAAWGGVHPVLGVWVAWGCAMTSRSIHIPKP